MEAEALKSDDVPFTVTSGKVIKHLDYHEKLNVILVGTDDELLVLDPTLGEVLYRTRNGK